MGSKVNQERQPDKLHRMSFNIPLQMAKEMIKICNERGVTITSFGATAIELAIKQHKFEKLQYLEVENKLKNLEEGVKKIALTA